MSPTFGSGGPNPHPGVFEERGRDTRGPLEEAARRRWDLIDILRAEGIRYGGSLIEVHQRRHYVLSRFSASPATAEL